MYTLEDDEETSSRLRKSDISGAQSAQAGAPDTTGVIDMSDMPTIPMVSQRVSRKITRSFRQLTTPSKGSGGAGVNQKAALAALTVACIGVFLTALDQTVVVTALPQIISDMQIPITQLDHAAWIVSAYLLGFAVRVAKIESGPAITQPATTASSGKVRYHKERRSSPSRSPATRKRPGRIKLRGWFGSHWCSMRTDRYQTSGP